MKVVDPGHEYLLDTLDGDVECRLVFVKREGPAYPGNVGHHPGTTIQEVLRALIDRLRYVNHQLPCLETPWATEKLCQALYALEERAARLHGRDLTALMEEVVRGTNKCARCGHIGCDGSCRSGDKHGTTARSG